LVEIKEALDDNLGPENKGRKGSAVSRFDRIWNERCSPAGKLKFP